MMTSLILPEDLKTRFRNIRCVVLDIDGVMTNGMLYLGPEGAEYKAVSVRDGLGIKQLLAEGIQVAVISGRPSSAIEKRLGDLGVSHLWLNVEDKVPPFESLIDKLKLNTGQIAVMGDDTPDLPLMERAGLSLTVADAHPRILETAHWCSKFTGGCGAIREASDLIIALQRLP